MPETDTRPLPRPTHLSQPFWDGCRDGKLLVQRCNDCGHYIFIPDPMCSKCQSNSFTWVESSGKGIVDSCTTVYRPQQPAFPVPYVVAIVQLEEGWYIPTNIVDTDPDNVTIGMNVKVKFDIRAGGFAVPVFVPA